MASYTKKIFKNVTFKNIPGPKAKQLRRDRADRRAGRRPARLGEHARKLMAQVES